MASYNHATPIEAPLLDVNFINSCHWIDEIPSISEEGSTPEHLRPPLVIDMEEPTDSPSPFAPTYGPEDCSLRLAVSGAYPSCQFSAFSQPSEAFSSQNSFAYERSYQFTTTQPSQHHSPTWNVARSMESSYAEASYSAACNAISSRTPYAAFPAQPTSDERCSSTGSSLPPSPRPPNFPEFNTSSMNHPYSWMWSNQLSHTPIAQWQPMESPLLPKPRQKYRFTPTQEDALKKVFDVAPYPTRQMKNEMADALKLPYKHVQIWFERRRKSEQRKLRLANEAREVTERKMAKKQKNPTNAHIA
ncbi:hypothetical protein CAPTEDRAFT_198993 [Capitella teleta]|uniref:Homeobox domain-containing protein n=1 Tax=Capitella teleta TaxID=283909 RepID=R7TQ32_CAPTE|nr:hypothetical protein CAPTEDRAFT_198993 [Capitella teleta]|eukprot:ELT95759.1 hypothetical protein CAPTEDRAFT_198993 [Capitella teleta]